MANNSESLGQITPMKVFQDQLLHFPIVFLYYAVKESYNRWIPKLWITLTEVCVGLDPSHIIQNIEGLLRVRRVVLGKQEVKRL